MINKIKVFSGKSIKMKNKNYETYNGSERARGGQSFLQVMEHFVKKLVIDFCNSDETLVKCQINTRETLVKHW